MCCCVCGVIGYLKLQVQLFWLAVCHCVCRAALVESKRAGKYLPGKRLVCMRVCYFGRVAQQ